MGKLVLFMADGTTRALNLGKERVVIGRRADNDICLPYPAVSGEHAAVVTILDDSFLEDLGSTNGTLVNGNAVQKHFLRDRDQIDIGQQKLVYLADESAQLEDLNINVVRKELKTFGEKVAPVGRSRRAQDVAPAIDAELARDLGQVSAEVAANVPGAVSAAAEDAPATETAAAPESPAAPMASASPVVPTILPIPNDVLLGADMLVQPPIPREALLRHARPRDAEKADGAEQPAAPAKVPSPDGGARASTDRGLARMAKLRNGNARSLHAANADEVAQDAEAEVSKSAVEVRLAPARITVLSGASAGRSLIIESDEVVIGRVGVQVAAIERGADGFRLRSREGDAAPLLNGEPVSAEGLALKSGDIFEVAGARLEFIAAN